jgi:hypothetical protein
MEEFTKAFVEGVVVDFACAFCVKKLSGGVKNGGNFADWVHGSEFRDLGEMIGKFAVGESGWF